MSEKTNISGLYACPLLRTGWICLLLLFPFGIKAQDSLRVLRDSLKNTLPTSGQVESLSIGTALEIPTDRPTAPPSLPDSTLRFSFEKPLALPYAVNPSPLLRGDYNTQGILMHTPRMMLTASGEQNTLPGIGRFNEAAVGMNYALNSNLSFRLGVSATQMNMAHYTGQAFGVSGAMLYRVSDRVAFKAFGGYATGNPYGGNYTHYGGSVIVDMSRRFGMEMGVQRLYDPMTGQWKTLPVVAPYYRFNKFTLGIDVGGLIYELLHNVIWDTDGRGSPTIAPPRQQMSLPAGGRR